MTKEKNMKGEMLMSCEQGRGKKCMVDGRDKRDAYKKTLEKCKRKTESEKIQWKQLKQ